MKKIMFNDKYGLTQAVLDGRKTMTRRIIPCPKTYKGNPVRGFRITGSKDIRLSVEIRVYDESCNDFVPMYIQPKYEVGEVVAIAQSYESVYHEYGLETMDMLVSSLKYNAGWTNKMFVKAEYMPNHIKITNIKVERLQDISNEDCLKEGIVKQEVISDKSPFLYAYDAFLNGDNKYFASRWFRNPRETFSILIDKVSGKGTWESNPYVWVYEFELFN